MSWCLTAALFTAAMFVAILIMGYLASPMPPEK